MYAIAAVLPVRKPVVAVAMLTFFSGVGGMAVSFLYLASDHPLDVTAGAAGFVAGAILVGAGLVAIALQRPVPAGQLAAGAVARYVPLAVGRWLAHFRRNQENRPEPDWTAPIALAADVVRPLLRSLEQFQLGDGGGPAYLIARDRELFLSANEGTRELVDLWFAEEPRTCSLARGSRRSLRRALH